MSQITQKRISKINVKVSIAKTDNGLRITVIDKSVRLGIMAKNVKSFLDNKYENDERLTIQQRRLQESLSFYSELPQIVNNSIPNLTFLANEEIINEMELQNVFVDSEILEWVDLFPKFVKMIKKQYKENFS